MAPPPRTIVCDAGALADPDVGTIGALARLQLALRRLGIGLRLEGVPGELAALLAFAGLSEALGVEPCGQPEQREQRRGIEEEAELADTPS
ncbi:MAG: STAS domain-containing protein [Solirubrobacteraceae bacterium]